MIKQPFTKYRRKIEQIVGRQLTNKKKLDQEYDGTEVSDFGEWIRENRNMNSMSLPELAKKAKISAAAIYNIESGKILYPQKSTRDKLAAAFGEPVPGTIAKETEQEEDIPGLGRFQDFLPNVESEWPQCPVASGEQEGGMIVNTS